MRSLFAAVVLTAFAISSCKDLDPPPPPPFDVYIKVESDPGHPVVGATVTRASNVLATTGPDGRAMITLTGAEGDTTDVMVKCPEILQSPTTPTTIRLTRYADPKKMPEYAVFCPPLRRHIVVAIRAENGANLPVKYLDKIVARTDVSGAAHFLLDAMPGEKIVVTLDTSEARRLSAQQQNPSTAFFARPADEILVWEQKFVLDKVKPIGIRRGPCPVACEICPPGCPRR
ncbi:MAG: hypothetical protein FWD69_09570 [Polyangiaceae bacterium]|nr:hypothetical protein [Polyangiaceae bacterium]